MKEKICGIYGIRHKESKRIYVGQSVNISNRFKEHKSDLRNNKHCNDFLQHSWNKYGGDAFEFIVLEECDVPFLSEKENYWMAGKDVYNLILDTTNHVGSNNPNFGKKNTLEVKTKMSENRSPKLNAKIVLEIKDLLVENKLSQQEIANRFGIGRTTVTRIASGARWANVTGGAISSEHVGHKNKFTDSHKKRIGQGRVGKNHSEESKEKIRLARMGTTHSIETRNKMKLAHLKRKEG